MKLSSSHDQLLSFCQARQAVENQAKRFKAAATEKVSLNRALARFLAMPIYADRDFPPFPRATRDGFAVRGEKSIVGHERNFHRAVGTYHGVEDWVRIRQ